MTLAGADARATCVESKALFVITRHNLAQFCGADREIVLSAGGQHISHLHPSAHSKFKPQPLGLMTQMFAEEFADFNETLVIHHSYTILLGEHFRARRLLQE